MCAEFRTLEVCREFLSNRCKREENDCRYAHPKDHIEVVNGQVTCCVDSLRDRCKRDDPPCRYFHPPPHLKEKLLIKGRTGGVGSARGFENGGGRGGSSYRGSSNRRSDSFGGRSDSFGGRSDSFGGRQFFRDGGGDRSFGHGGSSFEGNLFSGNSLGGPFGDAMEMFGDEYGGLNPLLATTLRGCKALLDAAANARVPPSSWVGGGGTGGNFGTRDMMHDLPPGKPNNNSSSNSLEVCRQFLRGQCKRPAEECRFAHPEPRLSINPDNTVTGCVDFLRGKCSRDNCRYFHPPQHLQSKIRRDGGSSFSGSRKRPFDSSEEVRGSWKRK